MDVELLRNETETEHRAVENLMPLMDPGLTPDQYGKTLQLLYRLVRSWEPWAQTHAPADLFEMVLKRQRAHLLTQDLLYLGITVSEDSIEFPAEKILGRERNEHHFRAAFLGAFYVIEGSRLGGQHIARHVEEALGLTPGEGDAYFRGHSANTGRLWREVKALLAELPENASGSVISSAKAMFGFFRDGLLSATAY
jgi:heme oxygenase (biliverdin-IX-beta and delta-forming)